ncbi:DUF3857 domain-containing protein [Aureisphaera galaxeae]|uniref:DUF3857 domain-containing protein n=1 Tax=Aureisphaera galaxeae TaxID=1538023 RepID=UPI002350210D|nr:DUF3857 domain-containing protein [Aureisphaera galaxeae]MDC8003174.1 DUF3857 domain-containing protein [Aureisphaera galaxeae]
MPKVTKEQLLEKQDDVFKDEPAKIIYRDIFFEFGNILKVREARKIYNNDGLDYSDLEIPYEEVEVLEAKTYNLVDDEIVITEVLDKQILKKEVTEDDTDVIIPFPNVREGSIIEIFYIVEDIGMWSIFYQSSLPIEDFHLSFSNPTPVALTLSKNGYSPIELDVNKKGKFLYYTGKDIPPLRDEGYLGSLNNYRGRLFIEVLLNYRRQKLKDWGDIAKYFNSVYWGGRKNSSRRNFKELLSDGNSLRKVVAEVVGAETDPKKRAEKIFTYVRDRMEWDGYYRDFSFSTKKVHRDEEGSAGAINVLLTTMLREAGLDANLMMIASKNRGFIHFITKNLFNYIVVHVNIDGTFYLLDASRKKSGFGELPIHFLNGDGLLLYTGRGHALVSTQARMKSQSSQVIDVTIDPEEMSVSADVKKRISGYFARGHRDDYEETQEKGYVDDLQESRDFLSISNMVVKEMDNPDRPLSIFYNLEWEEYMEEINGDLYFKPLLYFGWEENRLKQEERIYPLDFGFPSARKVKMNFKIPDGYEVKSLLDPVAITTPDNLASLSFNCALKGNQIEVSLNLNINQGIIPTEYYPSVKEIFAKYTEVSDSKIVLTKS